MRRRFQVIAHDKPQPVLPVQRQVHIIPIRIGRLDQLDFPGPLPGFDLVLPCHCAFACLMRFAPYEARELVFARERAATTGAVLVSAPDQVICVATIEGPVFSVRHDVNPEQAAHAGERAA